MKNEPLTKHLPKCFVVFGEYTRPAKYELTTDGWCRFLLVDNKWAFHDSIEEKSVLRAFLSEDAEVYAKWNSETV